MNMFEDFSERAVESTGVYKDLTGLDLDCFALDQQTTIDILVGSGVDLEDPNTFIIDMCEGITGTWYDVSANLSYLEDGENTIFGIDQQGFDAKWCSVWREANGELLYSLYDKDNLPLHTAVPDIRSTDMVDINDSTDYEEDENGNPIPQPIEYDCTITLEKNEQYHVYRLGTFTLDEGERLLQALGELPITHNRIEANNFDEIGYAWNNHDLTCADLLAMVQLCGLIADYTFTLK